MTPVIDPLSHAEQIWLLLNALISLAICARLLCYRKRDARHKRHMSLVAYVLIVAYGTVGVRILTGAYQGPVDPATVFANLAMLYAVWKSKGNVSRFLTGGQA
jgi:CHASE2 domain-containing sensor protein